DLAGRYQCRAVSLDMSLPDMVGWAVLSQLKQERMTRHIPVQVLAADDEHHHARAFGAFAHLQKPLSREALARNLEELLAFSRRGKRCLLIVEPPRGGIARAIDDKDVATDKCGSANDGLSLLRERQYDCVAVHQALKDLSGLDFLERALNEPCALETPSLRYAPDGLDEEPRERVRGLAQSLILREVQSPVRLLDGSALFLHRNVADLAPDKQDMLHELYESDEVLAGKKVL